MIRDLGARRKPAGFITVGSLPVFFMLCYLLHTRDRRVIANRSSEGAACADVATADGARFRQPDGPVPADRVLVGARHAVRRTQLRRLAPAGAAPPVVGQGGAVRVRHRAQPRTTATLPGHLLRRGDVVRHVRHRADLHLPVRRRPGVPRQLRRSGRCSPSASCSSALRLRGGPRCAGLGPAAAPAPPARDAVSAERTLGTHDPPRRHSKAASTKTTRPDERSSATSTTTGSAGSSTTRSPRSWRIWSTGRARAAAGRRTSGWPAAPSR